MDDFDRPLNERGRRDAPVMAAWLEEQNMKIDAILCSSSARTRETLSRLATSTTRKASTHFVDTLYLATADTIRALASQLDDSTATALLIAHNPGLHETALQLLTPQQRSQSATMRVSYPTAACAIIDLPIHHWADIAWDIGTLRSYMVPKARASSAADDH